MDTPPEPSPIRRVVTGHDADGNAVFVSDEEIHPFRSALKPDLSYRLWQSTGAATFPDGGQMEPGPLAQFPPVGGYGFFVYVFPPGGSDEPPTGEALERAVAEYERERPGTLERYDADVRGVHQTDTVDFGIVVRGQLVLDLDGEDAVVLKTGDVFVQNGTRHRWSNPGTEPAMMAVFLTGAHRR